MPPNVMPWAEQYVTYMVFLPKIHDLKQIMRQLQTNTNWGIVYKKLAHAFQNCQEKQRKAEEMFEIKSD